MFRWQVRVNLEAVFLPFQNSIWCPLLQTPSSVDHNDCSYQLLTDALCSVATLWQNPLDNLVFFRVFVFVLDIGLLINDQWWCLKKENSLPFDRWSIFILNPLTQRGCSELRATPVQLEPLGTPIGSDGKNWLESKSESVSEVKSLPANKKCKMEDADVVGFGVNEL